MKKNIFLLAMILCPLFSFAQEFRAAAENGDAEAQTKMGNYHFEKKEYTQALEWYRKAEAQGNAEAMVQLAECYENGYGVTKDEKKGVEYEKKAAALGNAKAQYWLGNTYNNGYGGEQQDYAKAVEWYRKAAEQGNADAQNCLGVLYYLGEGVSKDYAKAVEWYRKAAEQGNAWGQYNLGECYYSGEGVTKDYAKAVEWFRKAAEQGHAWGQYNLGKCYYYGNGVTEDEAKAVEWYRKAAEQGNASAQNRLGYCYNYGKGITKDYTKAVEWYRKAAEQGNAEAQRHLGYCYQNGEGVALDYTQALEWYKKAAEQEDEQAQAYLSSMYYTGEGVAKNDAVAKEWYNKALKNGYDEGNLIANIGQQFATLNNYAKAVEWYTKGSALSGYGAASCAYRLAVMYFYGSGVEKNLAKAKEYAQKAYNKDKNDSFKELLDEINGSVQDHNDNLAFYNNLVKKYGKANVDAVVFNHNVRVGMSIKLLMECANVVLYKMRVFNGGADGQYKVEIVHSGTAYSGMAAAPSAGIFYNNYRIWVSNYKITRFKEWTNADERDWKLMK